MTTEGMPVLEVYDANDLSKRPFRMDSDPMEIDEYYWATDDKIVFEARQKYGIRSMILIKAFMSSRAAY